MQGRLPIRVELSALTQNDLYRILTEPAFNLVKQQQVRGRGTRSPPLLGSCMHSAASGGEQNARGPPAMPCGGG